MTAFSNAAPAAPTGVTLIGGTKSITVRWNACPDYDYDYTRVEWSTSSGGTYTLFGTIKGTSLDVTGLNHSTTYWVRVAHVDSFGPTSLNYSTPFSTATNNFNSEVDARIGAAVISGSQLAGNSIPQSALSTEALYAPLAVIADVRNLVRNSLGDRGTDGWTSNAIQAVPNALDWSVYTSNTYKGKASLIFNDRDATYGDFVPVTPGDQFWCSCYNIPHGGTTGNYAFTLGLAIYNKDKTPIDWLGVVRPTSVSGGQLLQGSITVSHSDAVYVKPWVQINKTTGTFTGGTAGDGFFATAITVTRKNKGELIVDGSIFGQHLGVNTVTATNIDTRGLDIKDGAGTVIFSSGTPLSGTYINQGNPGNHLTNTENSSKERYVGKGWTVSNNFSAMTAEMTYETGLNLWPTGYEWFPAGTNPFVQFQNGVSGASATNYSQSVSDLFPVIPNQRYEASCYVQTHRCSATMYLVFFAEDGVTQLSAPNANTGGLDVPLVSFTTARDLSQWRRLGLFATAPAGARYGKMYHRKYSTFDTETVTLSSYAWWLYPYVGEAGVNQTTFSPYQPGAEWVPSGTVRSDNKITSTNVSTYIASAAIGEAYIGTITAAKIDSRNLTIKDAAGNILFGSGNNLDWSRISASSGWLNSNIGISSGALTGIGTGSGTVVANSNIVIDGGGVISGIGTGAGNTVANFAIGVNGSGQITGIGTGTNTPVSNNVIAQYGNLLTNTENKSNETPINKGWAIFHNTTGLGTTTTVGTELARSPSTPWDWQPVGANATYIYQVGTAAGTVTDYSDYRSEPIAAIPNTNYEFSVYVQTHRCKTEFYLVYFDQTDSYIGATFGGTANNVTLGGGTTARNLSQWARLGGIGTTPSNCVSIRIFIRKFRTDSGQADSYSWHLFPYLGRAGVNQTAISAYSPGAEWTPSNTVRADNPINLANISTYISGAAIGTAYIANLAVTTGKIANLAVDTLQIANQAVTVPASVTVPTWAGSGIFYYTNSYTDTLWGAVTETPDILLASITITTSGAPVTILTSCGKMPHLGWNGSSSGSSRLRLFRGSTLIAEGQHSAWGINGLDRVLNFRDQPSAGTHSYGLYFRMGNLGTTPSGGLSMSSGNGYCTNASIITLETKK